MKTRLYIIFVLIMVSIPGVFAIRGEIGNARAVINEIWEDEKTIERTLLVRNKNDIPIDITLSATDEIKDIIELIDKEFRLEPGEEKKARFNIILEKPGEWAGKITVLFKPEEGNAIVLASNLIINAGAPGDIEIPEDVIEDDDSEEDILDESDSEDNEITGDVLFSVDKEEKNNAGSNNLVFLLIFLFVIVTLIVGGVFFFRR